MLEKHAFEIYNASAGSGKTFTLVKEYLKIILSSKRDDAYKNILAITFTNKAVEEMKTRIVATLEEFAKETPNAKALEMLEKVMGETEMSQKAIYEKSKRIIKNIIHNYASFDISTIDKFTHRVIRSFTLDLDLPMTFEVSLDTESLLNEAIDSMIAQAGEDENLTKLLVDFATEKTDDDKSWDVSRDFLEIGKLLLNENNRSEILNFQDKSITEFLKIKVQISKICDTLEQQIKLIAVDTLTMITDSGVELGSFFSGYVTNFLQKLADGKIDINTNIYKYLDDQHPDAKDRYSKKVPQDQKDKIDAMALDVLATVKKLNRSVGTYSFYKAFLKNLTPLSVLNTINHELLKIQQEQNILSISEFNNIIHDHIKEQPAPFIYEKLGERYTHFFIDEFQDTSIMQWENLFPLIDNALSGQNDYGEKGSLMIVGDPKQSIYRWRGGRAEQFIELSEDKSPFSNPDIKAENLATNFRSYAEVIEFNNSFFGFLANDFTEASYKKIYADSTQKINNKSGGYVTVSFVNQDEVVDEEEAVEKNELYLKAILDRVEQLKEEGFLYSEMAILVRKKLQGIWIANYFTENNIPFISSETLLVSSSDQVLFIIELLEFIKNKINIQAKANFLYFIGRQLEVESIHDFIKNGVRATNEKEFEAWLLSCGYDFSFEIIRKKSLYETAEIIVSVFLKDANNVYIMSFLDLILEQNIRNQSSIDDFLLFWKEQGHKKSIPSPKRNAIQILTIHKSKGLEFPVVIFPFADEDYARSIKDKLWVDNDIKEIELSRILVDNTKSVENYSEKASETLYHKNQEELLDNINILYVALTRAVEQLHVISSMRFLKSGDLPNTMGSLFIRFLSDKKDFHQSKLVYEFGSAKRRSIPKEKELAQKTISVVEHGFDIKNIKIATLESLMWNTKMQESIEYGNLLHKILSFINSANDVEYALQTAIENGMITTAQMSVFRATLQTIIGMPELEEFYSPSNKIINERTIIRKEAAVVKPDKVILKPNNEALLLDYKTGDKAAKHLNQINTYATALEEMGYTVSKKTLVYVKGTIEIVNA